MGFVRVQLLTLVASTYLLALSPIASALELNSDLKIGYRLKGTNTYLESRCLVRDQLQRCQKIEIVAYENGVKISLYRKSTGFRGYRGAQEQLARIESKFIYESQLDDFKNNENAHTKNYLSNLIAYWDAWDTKNLETYLQRFPSGFIELSPESFNVVLDGLQKAKIMRGALPFAALETAVDETNGIDPHTPIRIEGRGIEYNNNIIYLACPNVSSTEPKCKKYRFLHEAPGGKRSFLGSSFDAAPGIGGDFRSVLESRLRALLYSQKPRKFFYELNHQTPPAPSHYRSGADLLRLEWDGDIPSEIREHWGAWISRKKKDWQFHPIKVSHLQYSQIENLLTRSKFMFKSNCNANQITIQPEFSYDISDDWWLEGRHLVNFLQKFGIGVDPEIPSPNYIAYHERMTALDFISKTLAINFCTNADLKDYLIEFGFEFPERQKGEGKVCLNFRAKHVLASSDEKKIGNKTCRTSWSAQDLQEHVRSLVERSENTFLKLSRKSLWHPLTAQPIPDEDET